MLAMGLVDVMMVLYDLAIKAFGISQHESQTVHIEHQ